VRFVLRIGPRAYGSQAERISYGIKLNQLKISGSGVPGKVVGEIAILRQYGSEAAFKRPALVDLTALSRKIAPGDLA